MSLGILKGSGLSPEGLKYYRSDSPSSEDGEKTTINNMPWQSPFTQHLREKAKRAIGEIATDVGEEVKMAAKIKEVMRNNVFQLHTLLNCRDHVFNVDVFKKPTDFTRDHPDRSIPKPGSELPHMTIKALCRRNVFCKYFNVVENIYSRFHYDPVLFKRFFLINSLYYLGGKNGVNKNQDLERCTILDCIDIANGKGQPTGNNKNNDMVYDCQRCKRSAILQQKQWVSLSVFFAP